MKIVIMTQANFVVCHLTCSQLHFWSQIKARALFLEIISLVTTIIQVWSWHFLKHLEANSWQQWGSGRVGWDVCSVRVHTGQAHVNQLSHIPCEIYLQEKLERLPIHQQCQSPMNQPSELAVFHFDQVLSYITPSSSYTTVRSCNSQKVKDIGSWYSRKEIDIWEV